MSRYGNVYSNPEDFDLQIVAEEDTIGGYEWDVFVVWRSKDGKFYFGHDSGCSCNSPFEYGKVDSLIEVDSVHHVRTLVDRLRYTDYDFGPFYDKVRLAMNAPPSPRYWLKFEHLDIPWLEVHIDDFVAQANAAEQVPPLDDWTAYGVRGLVTWMDPND